MHESRSFKTDAPILSPETFRTAADFIIDGPLLSIETNDLFDGCVIYVSLEYLKSFYDIILPKIAKKVIIVTHGHQPFYHYPPEESWHSYIKSEAFLTPKFAAHPNVLAFFSKNNTYDHPKCHGLPIGKSFFHPSQSIPLIALANKLSLDDYFKEKPIQIYLNILCGTHSSRPLINDIWKNRKGVTYKERVRFYTYLKQITNSRFVISPIGDEPDCFRTWEVLWSGSIPVVMHIGIDELYEDLPVILVDDLATLTLEELYEKYEELKTKEFNLDKLFAPYWIDKIRSCGKECIDAY